MTAVVTAPLERPITVRAAPRREPPFDDELVGDSASSGGRQPRLAAVMEQPLPFDEWPPVPPRADRQRSWAAPTLAGRGTLPDPASSARKLLVALLEARAGLRPLRQLAGWLSPAVLAGLSTELARVPAPETGVRQATVKSVHVCEPADGIAEIAVVVCTGTRHRAIAARLEGLDGRWRCIRLQLG
jgi:uncharacterized protein DUF6459